ncbi:MAG TPA: FkbM family methyltransferase [Stellaceae bacterium]|nr:FkbM family methyltransferase [Stellaceae bacterium]
METSQSGATWRRRLQGVLLSLFATVRRTGVLDSRPGRWAFENSYELYKRLIEAGEIDRLAPFIPPGSLAIDVGANVGFFTTRFARWVGPQGAVIAIEPEAVNFARLRRRIDGEKLADRVECLEAAACEAEGTVLLEINPDHPGDHKLGASGVPIRAVALDDLVAARGWPAVSLIKIDVQGAELRVLAGVHAVIERFHPAMFIEVDDGALRRLGGSAASLIETMASFGYRAHRLGREGVSPPLPEEALAALSGADAGYTDLLFLPAPP